MNKVNRFFLLLIFFVLFQFSCTDQSDLCGNKGTITDMLGVDACTLVILDDKGDVFVPDNILEFGLAFYDGQKISFSHRLSTENLPCFRGVPVTLICIQPEE